VLTRMGENNIPHSMDARTPRRRAYFSYRPIPRRRQFRGYVPIRGAKSRAVSTAHMVRVQGLRLPNGSSVPVRHMRRDVREVRQYQRGKGNPEQSGSAYVSGEVSPPMSRASDETHTEDTAMYRIATRRAFNSIDVLHINTVICRLYLHMFNSWTDMLVAAVALASALNEGKVE
jgi:hypothetical protein